jgi:hypothetical protein
MRIWKYKLIYSRLWYITFASQILETYIWHLLDRRMDVSQSFPSYKRTHAGLYSRYKYGVSNNFEVGRFIEVHQEIRNKP